MSAFDQYARDGMAWWNGLCEVDRGLWMHLAGDTGRVSDAYAFFLLSGFAS